MKSYVSVIYRKAYDVSSLPARGIVYTVRGDVALEGSRWGIDPTSFAQPKSVLVADSVEEVEGCFRAAEAAAAAGNWVVGFVSYDAAPGFDHRLITPGRSDLPLVWFGVYASSVEREAQFRATPVGQWTASMTPEQHAGAVESIRCSIEAGDTYQANLTFAMDAQLDGEGVDLFRRMVRSQKKSYGAFLDLGDTQIVSISPELFLSGSGRRVTARPMKGTAPRGRSSYEDARFVEQLVSSEKERAGNMMIVDLVRNDLGRVSETGSVTTRDLCRPERYPTVWQLTSAVEGVLRNDVSLVDLFAAAFPSGSVTGAPKVSTMEIISRLETVPRGVYCGAIGYIAPGGEDFEFSVAIRTGVVQDGSIRYHVGGGITHDSMAGAEYEECLWKALAVTAENVVPALLETMLYRPGVGIELLDRHLLRLSESADFWEIPLDLEAVGDALSSVRGHHDQKVRLILMPDGDAEVEVDDVEVTTDPVELSVSQQRVDPTEPHWFHKTLDRSRYPVVDDGEVVMVNLRGEVTETNISNLMVRFGDDWVTPPPDSGCLPGVYRQKLLDEGEVVERVVTLDEFRRADEIAVINAVRGRRKAVLVE